MSMNKHLFSVLILSATASAVCGQTTSSVPKLVVGITIDKLRSDYMDAFSPIYGEGGFKRLLDEGVVYPNIQYSTANVDRASSVSSIYTGTVPYNHGIVGEAWLDRSSLRPMYCVDDFKFRGHNTSDYTSPKNLLVSTIGDELKIATEGKAKVYSVAPFKEVAILSAGHAADWAMWIDDVSGKWAGTSYFGSAPSWTKYVDVMAPSENIQSITWQPSNLVVESYNYYLSSEKKSKFSHKFIGDRRFKEYKNSACVNEEVTRVAKSCIDGANLGSDGVTDMLSLCYYAGTFDNRPMSEVSSELQDTYVRLDAELKKLLDEIEKKVGLQNTLIFLTSTGQDSSEPYDLSKYRIPTGTFRINRCAALLNVYLMAIYGQGQIVDGYYGNQLYLNHKLIEEKQLNLSEILDRCEDFLFQHSGIRDVYTSHRLTQGAWTPGINRIRNSYNPKCSGDILIEVIPGWTLENEDLVSRKMVRDSFMEFPLIFFGNGLDHQRIRTEITIDRIAPTISHFIRIRAPNASSAAPLSEVGK
jgi:hypothetical protein